jgi:serine protease AprX
VPEIRLPIKIVLPHPEDYQRDIAGGGPRTIFDPPVTEEIRNTLSEQVKEVAEYFEESFTTESLPAVARVVLKKKALAKSHRPSGLLNQAMCPIIGVEDLGELLISVRPSKLKNLEKIIRTGSGQNHEANISTIERIEPFKSEDALSSFSQTWMHELLQVTKKLKFRLFQHQNLEDNSALEREFLIRVKYLGLPAPIRMVYGHNSIVYKIEEADFEDAQELSRFIGTQSVGPFPHYRAVRTEAVVLRRANNNDLLPPNPNETYPLVGIIDSGVNPHDSLLAPWVEYQESYVPQHLRDYTHGSFVAGLIVGGHRLNHQDSRFPKTQAKIVDVIALPKAGIGISEDDLLTIIEDVVLKYPEVRVWNLSLGMPHPTCDNKQFSLFAMALDRIQDQHNVTFIIAAGNFNDSPYRGWPPENLGETDRICPPADSVRSIVVGSVAHRHTPNSRVQSEEPSPFSKRGPGAAFLPKPEVTHYGGNCSQTGSYAQMGVLSVDGAANLAENIGTSFATPLITSIFSNVYHSLSREPSRIMAKALLIHSAALRNNAINAKTLPYLGFGIPSDINDILTCTPSSATLIFETEINPGIQYIKDNFPIPRCLLNSRGEVKGEFVVTLVSQPPLDGQYGSEYCRRNLSVSLGTYEIDKSGFPRHKKQVPEVPKDLSKLYEQHSVEHGFKWSPVKVYKRTIPRGITGRNWRLVIEGLNRSGFSSIEPTPVVLIITIRDIDPDSTKPVYDQVVAQMIAAGWATQDIPITHRVRSRIIS